MSSPKRFKKLKKSHCFSTSTTTTTLPPSLSSSTAQSFPNINQQRDYNNNIKREKLADFFVTEKKFNDDDELYYPNCDANVWLRSCRNEIISPLVGQVKGLIPKWINGCLIRNGPGSLEVADMKFEHLFDSSALLHKFKIENGTVSYQCRFLKSKTFEQNQKAKRIVVMEFGTISVPDPCKSIFQKIVTCFKPAVFSDNAMISVYPFGDELYAFNEIPIVHKINTDSLETEKQIHLDEYVNIVNHTSHPHILNDGSVVNLGMSTTKTGPKYTIVRFPLNEAVSRESTTTTTSQPFKKCEIVASIKARWPLYPSYMHTFGITEHYYIIVEQPLSVSVPKLLKNLFLKSEPLATALKWFENEKTHIYVINRQSGEVVNIFCSEAFFYLHIINQFEMDMDRNTIVLDICCYRNPEMLNCMYIESMKKMQKNANYANLFRSRPLRFTLRLNNKHKEQPIDVEPEMICSLGCETPRINYETYAGKKYRYFYAISADVDADNPGAIIKVDCDRQNYKIWCEKNMYPSEPIFLPHPKSKFEDDGVVLSAYVYGGNRTNIVGLLILDARSWTEIGRAVFETPSEVPKCLHGWFLNNSKSPKSQSSLTSK